jgi:methionyl-tRNA synthetase
MKHKYLITSALLYSNGVLHFGHLAGAFLPADAFARFKRMMGDDVLYISGSDEYGVAITMSAEIAGRSPKEHVDHYHAINKSLFEKLDISFDHYSRTTWSGHEAPVQEFFTDLLENGFIEPQVTKQLYSEKEKKFLADRYVTGTCPRCQKDGARGDECPYCGASYEATDLINPRSKLTGSELSLQPTKHWFLRFDLFKEKLLAWLEKKKWKPNVVNFVESYIRDLKPRGITRDGTWGVKIPLPDTEGKILYVWFDAPIGYITATQEWALKKNQPDAWKHYWLDPQTKLVHFIGKDNIPFHAIFFPAMCMGQNTPYKLVDEIPANEFLNLEGKQFSKSAGWTIDMEEFLEQFSSDQIRYVLAANAPETADAEFTWVDFQARCNAELVGKFGNFVNRTFVFAQKHCELKVPLRGFLETADEQFIANISRCLSQAQEAYEQFSLRKATQTLMELCSYANTYFDNKKPWVDAKEQSSRPRMETTIWCCLHAIKALALIASPLVPKASQRLFAMLGISKHDEWKSVAMLEMEKGHALNEPTILFGKIEDSTIQEQINKLHSLVKS